MIMRDLCRKLKSSGGASVIIAMVFMLICVFVGGSVLTAATSNAYRIKHLSDQQDYLNQRSAALLVSDELKNADGTKLRLTVHDNIQHVKPVRKTHSGDLVPDPSRSSYDAYLIRFSLPAGQELTGLQRTVYETAIYNYLKNHGVYVSSAGQAKKQVAGSEKPVVIEIDNFIYNGTTINFSDFWCKYEWTPVTSPSVQFTGTFEVTVNEATGTEIAKFTGTYSSAEGEELYDYRVSFLEDRQLKTVMNALPGITRLPNVTEVIEIPNPDYTAGGGKTRLLSNEVTTESTLTVISWETPKILKGAAE